MKKIILFLPILSLLFFSCKKDVVDVIDKGELLTIDHNGFFCQIDTANLDIYDFNQFITKGSDAYGDFGDVKFLNADTTLISVSKDYIKLIKDEPVLNSVLVLSLNDTTVINTRIKGLEDSDNVYKLKIIKIPMEEVFNNLSLTANISDYYNPDESTKSYNSKDEPWKDFIDNNGVIHPVKSFIRSNNGDYTVVDHKERSVLSTKWGPSFNLGFNIESTLDLDIKDELGAYHFKLKPSIEINGGVGFKLDIHWFSLKHLQLFAEAGVDIKFPIGLAIGGKKEGDLIDKLIYQDKFSYKFAIGPVPVIFNFAPGVRAKLSYKIEGYTSINTGFTYKVNTTIGAKYENGNWTPIKENTNKFEFIKPEFRAELNAELEALIGPNVEVGFYGVYMGEMTLGGYGEIDANGKYILQSDEKQKLKATLDVEAGLKAGLAFKLKILKYEIGKWETFLKLFSVNLYSDEWEVDLGPLSLPNKN